MRPLDLIHRNNSPHPHQHSFSGRLGVLSDLADAQRRRDRLGVASGRLSEAPPGTAGRSPPPQENSPGELQLAGAGDVEPLLTRIERYAVAKARANDVAHFMAASGERKLAGQVEHCGEYLVFRHYFTVAQVRLHAAQFCKKHTLCQLCAIRRGAKSLEAYMPRYEAIRAQRPDLRPYLVTLTVKDGPDLGERFKHLHQAQRELWKRKQRAGEAGRNRAPSSLGGVEAAVWSYEVKRGGGSGLWHPHLHMAALAAVQPDARALSAEWLAITGDSFIVDVRPIDTASPQGGFAEVFKYALKFSDMDPADTVRAFQVLRGRRLLGSAGLFRGIEVPDSLTDEPLDGLPYVELFFRYTGAGYQCDGHLPAGLFSGLAPANTASAPG